MAALVQAKDWAQTLLGAQELWSPSLCLATQTVLACAFPMALRWGPDFVLIYNDAYRPILGDKHPWALGRPAREAWSEVWSQIEAAHRAIYFEGAPAMFAEDMLLPIQRHATTWENARFTLSYSPIGDATSPAGVGGILVTAVETTERSTAAEALRRSDERYSLALSAAGAIGTWDWDIVADRVFADALFAEQYSVDPAHAAAGAPIAEFVDGIHPDDRDRVAAQINASIVTGDALAAEYRLMRRDGSVTWVLARGRCQYDTSGAAVRFPGVSVDITDRKVTETALLESRSYLTDLLSSSGEAFYAVDPEGSTTLCNQAFLRMTGFGSEADVLGRKLHDVIHHSHPDGSHYDKLDCPIYRCASSGVPAHVQDENFFRLDGTSFPVEYRAYPVVRDGVRHGAICTFVDISDRRAAEAELARSEAEFRTFSQAVPDHVWASAPDGNLNWFNDRVYEYCGAVPGELDGSGWADIVHPDDRAAAGARWASSLATGEVYQTEFRLRRADGTYRWHLGRALPIREGDTIARWIGTNTDIEEQKAVAAALESLNANLEQRVATQAAERDRLWQTSQDLLVVVDAKGTFTAANPAWTSVLGWLPSEVIGRNHLFFVHSDYRAASQAILEEALDAPIAPFVNQCRHKDGTARWISWIASSDQEMVYATGRNVTAEREAAAELTATQDALRQAQKMEAVGQLTGGIAHDFNNLLAGISGSLEVIERRLSQGRYEGLDRFIEGAQSSSRRAAALTQRLLAFSRRQTLDPKPTDINRLIAGMEELIRRTVGPAIDVEVVGAGGLWLTKVDPPQLESALLNLAINARDAMPDGGRITIETANKWLDMREAKQREVPAGQYLSLCVTDTGTGMPPALVDKIFEPFFTTKPIGQGTGLGLSMIHGFVRQSGGQVRVYSEVGKGTTMCLYLPRYVGELEQEHGPGDGVLTSNGAGETVLIIDDEPTVRMLIVEVVQEAGFQAIEAEDGPAGLRILQSEVPIDLLVTDVGLPGGLNGRQVADAARAIRPDLKVLFVTGFAENAAVGNGLLDLGMEVMTKPFVMGDLQAKIRDMIES